MFDIKLLWITLDSINTIEYGYFKLYLSYKKEALAEYWEDLIFNDFYEYVLMAIAQVSSNFNTNCQPEYFLYRISASDIRKGLWLRFFLLSFFSSSRKLSFYVMFAAMNVGVSLSQKMMTQ